MTLLLVGLAAAMASVLAYVAAGTFAGTAGDPSPIAFALLAVSLLCAVFAPPIVAFGAAVMLLAGALAMVWRPWRSDPTDAAPPPGTHVGRLP